MIYYDNGDAFIEFTQQKTNKKLNIVFKVYDEGVAFRYEFPFENGVEYFIVSEEKSEFNLTGNHKSFWIPGDYDSQEYAYNTTKISEINNSKLESTRCILYIVYRTLYINIPCQKLPFTSFSFLLSQFLELSLLLKIKTQWQFNSVDGRGKALKH